MDYKPFSVKRLPREDGSNHCKDKTSDWFAIEAKGNRELLKHGGIPPWTSITAFLGGRSEAQRLCDMLNQAWDAFHNGDTLTTFKGPTVTLKELSS